MRRLRAGDLLSTLPVRAYPWVTHEITSRRECAEYLQKDFTEAALKLGPRLSAIVSKSYCYACVAIMQALRANSRLRNSRKILGTLQYTSTCSNRAKTSSFSRKFPHAKNTQLGDSIRFLAPCAHVLLAHSQPLTFVPIAVNKKVRRISIGSPVIYNPTILSGSKKSASKRKSQAKFWTWSLPEEARISG